MSGRSSGRAARSARRAHGFTYLGILFVIALLGGGLAATGIVHSTAAQREREQELLFVGHEFRDAIRSYYLSGPVGTFSYPQRLEDLVEDRRGPIMKRHLRRIYADPMTGQADWELITLGDGVLIGVVSRSVAKPMKIGNFSSEDIGFSGAGCYCDWRFAYLPQQDVETF